MKTKPTILIISLAAASIGLLFIIVNRFSTIDLGWFEYLLTVALVTLAAFAKIKGRTVIEWFLIYW